MNTNRVSIVIVTLIYLVAIFFFLEAIGNYQYENKLSTLEINATSTTQSLGMDVKFLGMNVKVFGGFLGNIITGISTLPIWFNTIFIIIPAIILAVFTIMMFIPTIPSG